MINNIDTNLLSKNSTTLFFSNSFEKLAENLATSLFQLNPNPLTQQFVLVPCPAIKNFLKHYFASSPHLNVFAGIKLLTIQEALNLWLKKETKETGRCIPSILELKLLVQESILYLCSQELPEQVEKNLKDYIWPLHTDDKILKLDIASFELAEYFSYLDVYGEKLREDKKFVLSWKGYLWSVIKEKKEKLVFCYEAIKQLESVPIECHLFGFSYLPSLFCDFFKSKSSSFYLFSPCEEYWEDFCTEYEKIAYRDLLFKLKAKKGVVDSFEEFVKDQHPLLASFGKKARLFLKKFTAHDFISFEDYTLQANHSTILGKIQKDLLNAEVHFHSHIEKDDISLRIHACPSKQREVEVLHDCLYRYFEEAQTKRETLSAKDIVVVCPDLASYFPYIQMVFDNKDSLLGYTIHSALSVKSDVKVFTSLIFNEASKRFDKEFFFDLLDLASFRDKLVLSQEEVYRLKEWINEANIRWGFNDVHKQEIIGNTDFIENVSHGTWLHGISSLLRGLAITLEGEDLPQIEGSWPVNVIESSEIPIIKKWIPFCFELYRRIKELNGESKTVPEWLETYKLIIQDFLTLNKGDEDFLTSLDKMSHSLFFLKEKIPFNGLKTTIENLFSQNFTTCFSEKPNRIAFWPFNASCITTQKVVCLLGMDEDSFPKNSIKPMIQELSKLSEVDDIIAKADENRFNFLEALALTSQFLWISYKAFDAQHNSCEPSIVVKELLELLKNSMGKEIIEKIWIKHEPYGFSSAYFAQSSITPSYSKKFYLLAKNLSQNSKASKTDFLPLDFNEYLNQLPEPKAGHYEVDIKDLLFFCKDPEGFYKEKIVGIRKEWEEPLSYVQEFSLNRKVKNKLQKSSIYKGFEEAWSQSVNEQGLPVGILKEVIKEKQKQDYEENKKLFEGISISDVFTLSLGKTCVQKTRNKNVIFFPAFTFTLQKSLFVKIYGSFEDVTSKGILIFDENNLAASAKAKLFLVILNQYPNLNSEIEGYAFFAKGNKVLEFQSSYLDFFKEKLQVFLKLILTQKTSA